MKVFPALKAAAAFALGITLALWCPIPFHIGLITSLSLLLLVVLPLYQSFKVIALYGALISAGAANFLSFENSVIPATSRLHLVCRVEEQPLFRDGYYSFPARVFDAGFDSLDLHEFRQTIWVKGKGIAPPDLGAYLLATGELKPFRERKNPGDFDLKRWRSADGFIGEFAAKSIQEISVRKPFSPIISARKWLSDSCDRLATHDASLWKGLLLGFRRDIDPTLMEELRQTGLTHLLALSGLNVGFLALAFIGFGSLLRLNLSARVGLALLLVIVYSQIIPDRGSTLRATIMTAAMLLGYLFRKWTPSLNSIGFAGLLILAYRPLDLFDPGFQMSLAATFGIFIFAKDIFRVNNWRRSNSGRIMRFARHWILVPLAVSFAASTFVAPFTSHFFSSIPLAGPFFNLLGIPLLGVVYAGAWMAVLTQPLGAWVSQLLADGVLTLSLSWQTATHYMATVAPEWRVTLPPWSVILIISLLIWAGVSTKAYYKRIILLVGGIAAVLVFSRISGTGGNFRALFLDVGHGDAQAWLFPDGSTYLIDAGPAPHRPEGSVEKFLRHANRDKLTLIVASHPDADHIGGFRTIIDNFEIENAVSNYSPKSTQTFDSLLQTSRQRMVAWQQVSADDSIVGLPDGYDLDILNPPRENPGWSDNDLSVVLRLSVPAGNHKYHLLTTGDIEESAEYYLVTQNDCRAELLKIPHHGSSTSSSAEFIEAVSPKFGVVSRGWSDKRVGAAAREEVVNRYEAAGAEVLYTDVDGAILMEASPDGWRRIDWRQPRFWDWLWGRL